MKKAVLGLAVILSFGSAAMAQSKGDIKFTGEVLKAACSVAPVSDVKLGSVSTKTLNKPGAASQWASSSIEFYDCLATDPEGANDDGVAAVDLVITDGEGAVGAADLWANLAGTAENVGLELKIANQAVVPATGLEIPDLVPTKAGTLSVPIQARMKAATGAVKEGTFVTTVSFTATYK